MPPHIVKEETDDRIVLVDSVAGNIIGGSFIIAIGLFVLFFVIDLDCESQDIFSRLIFILLLLFGVFVLFAGLYTLIIRKTIIVDKRLQTAIVMKEVFLTHFKFIKKISFIDITHIEITINIEDGKATGHRDIALIMIDGTIAKIYDGNCETVEKLSKNIRNITGKQISHKKHSYSTSTGG